MYWTTFARKNIIRNFQESPNLVTHWLHLTTVKSGSNAAIVIFIEHLFAVMNCCPGPVVMGGELVKF